MDVILNEIITDHFTLSEGYLYRDGFVFTRGQQYPAVFDRLVVRTPMRTRANERKLGYSNRTLPEHIALINRYKIDKVMVICDDLSFLTQCPSVSDVVVFPSYDADSDFDYAPLYSMPNIRRISCTTIYGTHGQHKTSIDYSRMPLLEYISISGSGHIGYLSLRSLREIHMSNIKTHTDFRAISGSDLLTQATMLQSRLQTLDGIEKHRQLTSLVLYNNHALRDISALQSVAASLTELVIESSSRIKDFSVLETLTNLEHLQLCGNNMLENLDFLRKMTKLKTFTFTMNVENGDLSPCLMLPYASCRNRKHFNLRDEQLPK